MLRPHHLSSDTVIVIVTLGRSISRQFHSAPHLTLCGLSVFSFFLRLTTRIAGTYVPASAPTGSMGSVRSSLLYLCPSLARTNLRTINYLIKTLTFIMSFATPHSTTTISVHGQARLCAGGRSNGPRTAPEAKPDLDGARILAFKTADSRSIFVLRDRPIRVRSTGAWTELAR